MRSLVTDIQLVVQYTNNKLVESKVWQKGADAVPWLK